VFNDNKTIKIKGSEILLSTYFWKILSKFDVPIDSRVLLSNFYTNGYYTKSTLNGVLAKIKEIVVYEKLIPSDYLDL